MSQALRAVWLLALLLAGMLAWSHGSAAWAQQAAVPALNARITDTTGTLDAATRERLTLTLEQLEQRKGAQIAVLMIPSTQGESIEQYAVRAFEQWRLGRKGVDDGILFLVAKDDRRMRIEVGYGLEGAVPDLLAGRIIREQVAPRFAAGDFAGGVQAGVDSLVGLVEGEELPPVAAQAAQTDADSPVGPLLPLLFMAWLLPPLLAVGGCVVLVLLVTGSWTYALLAGMAALLVSLFARARGFGPRGGLSRASRHGSVLGGGLGAGGGFGRRGGGGFGSGGFGSGGFGGGGGSSGGGGASGGW